MENDTINFISMISRSKMHYTFTKIKAFYEKCQSSIKKLQINNIYVKQASSEDWKKRIENFDI